MTLIGARYQIAVGGQPRSNRDTKPIAIEAAEFLKHSFQVEAFPFRMTPLNMARHRNSPHMAFWRRQVPGDLLSRGLTDSFWLYAGSWQRLRGRKPDVKNDRPALLFALDLSREHLSAHDPSLP
jgi:hypothetical protein